MIKVLLVVAIFVVVGSPSEILDDNDDATTVDIVCSKSKVAYEKVLMRHNWRINGLVEYIKYLNKFNIPFEVQSDNVKFRNTKFDGKWTFKLAKDKNQPQPLILTATYKYEAATADPKKFTFDMSVTAFIEDSSVELPVQMSSTGELTGQRQDYRPGVSYAYVFDFIHKFKWADFATQMRPILESDTPFGNLDIDLQFFITGYIPKEPESTNISCQPPSSPVEGSNISEDSNEIASPPIRNKRFFNPPFLSHMVVAMKEDKYTDLIIKTGDDEFPAHKVILANSSPVLASMIFNLTFDKNESLLDLGDEIGADVVEELIRYTYTGKVEAIEEIADRLIVTADKYELPNLKALCESVLTQQVRMENAIQMYTLGNEVKSSKLTRKAFAVMKANKSKIAAQSEEFRKLSVHYPNLMFELFLS
ncbi:unnamed protein product [Allacma fusca]|uniref:BTB domain-containing protein n=1 Tax=Allacma fusca TaxID=39272 RepID=A0A8J2JS44_9HEXA|nr:unnamed protein product [Allacma fusca]